MVYQIEPQSSYQHQPHLACPQCSQHTMVHHGSVYTCLNCNFQRNIAQPGESRRPEPMQEAIAVVIITILLLLGLRFMQTIRLTPRLDLNLPATTGEPGVRTNSSGVSW